MIRAAVEQGTDATRLVVHGPDGRAEPVAVLPSGTSAAAALDELVGPASGPVALVHPPDWDDERVAAAVRAPALDVRAVPAPVAVLGVLAGEPGPCLVVDAGRSGTTLTVVDDGGIRCTAWLPVGGDRLDALLVTATGCPADRVRRARETLSFADRVDVPGHGPLAAATVAAVLRPELACVARRAAGLAAGVVEVVLTGGLARTPLLAELLDERTGRPARVLPEPNLAAVRGALRSAEAAVDPDPDLDPAAPDPDPEPGGRACAVGCGVGGGAVIGAGVVEGGTRSAGRDETTGRSEGTGRWVAAGGAAGDGDPAADGGAAESDGPTRLRRGLALPAVAVAGVLLVGAGTALGASAGAPVPPGGTLVQYGYAVALPAGWEHSGGDPARRRTLLTRIAAPDGVELVSVERSPLGYDSAAEPDRARGELAAVHRGAAAQGLGELRPGTVSGRAVTRYRQQAGPDAVVDWVVLFDGTDELAVGCRRPARGPSPELERACADVVRSVRVAGRPG